MRFSVDDALVVTGGELLAGETSAMFEGAWHDSRSLQMGALFVAIVDRRDGHDYIPDALAAGAPGYLTSMTEVHAGGFALGVADTRRALVALGRAARKRVPALVAVTGSAGKTTTKDFLTAVLASSCQVGTAPGSHNNELGMPLTLLNSPDDADVVIAEIGARKAGDVAWGTDLLDPTIGIVTNVGSAHLGEFGSRERIAAAKGELPRGLSASATAVLNVEDSRVMAMANHTAAKILTFGAGGDVRAEDNVHLGGLVEEFRLVTPTGSAVVRLAASGPHIVSCALAAAAAATVMGMEVDLIAAALSCATRSAHRMVVETAPLGWKVLNDSYNANPDSMRAALQATVRLAGSGRVLALLGHMAELGSHSEAAHVEIGRLAQDLGVSVVVGVGDYAEVLAGSDRRVASHPSEAVSLLRQEAGGFRPGDAILVKGSRMVGLEQAIPFLLES